MAKSTLNKSLKKRAIENTQVSSKKKGVLKEGTPLDHTNKTKPHHVKENTGIVGVSLGITKNQGDYESLRVDTWLTDLVQEDETVEGAFERVTNILDNVLVEIVESYST